MARFLFICGVARSGTTAVTELLNRHPEIAIGVERFKGVPPSELSPDLFSHDRFFDFRETDTNIKLPRHYEKLAAKFDSAKIIGDKVPRYYVRYNVLMERFPGSQVIYMLRDIDGVALSWDARSANKEDHWPESNNYEKAVEEWNKGIALTIDAKAKYGKRIIIVAYEDLFFGDIAVLQRLMRRIDLPLAPQERKFFEKRQAEFKPNARSIKPEQRKFIDRTADREGYLKLREFAIPGNEAKAA